MPEFITSDQFHRVIPIVAEARINGIIVTKRMDEIFRQIKLIGRISIIGLLISIFHVSHTFLALIYLTIDY
jgi:hypothetical protein